MAKSQNEIIYDHISSFFDSKDYTKPAIRRESLEEIMKQNPELKQHSAMSAHQKMLEKISKEKGLDPLLYKGTQKKSTKVKYDPSMNPNITGEPANIPDTTAQKPIVAQGQPPQGQVLQPMTYDAEAVGAFFDGIYSGLRIPLPEMEPLKKEQVESLGKLWVNQFNKRFQGHENAEVVMAIGATLGIMGGNITRALVKRQERRRKEKGEDKTPTQRLLEPKKSPIKEEDDPYIERPLVEGTDE